MVKGAEHGFQVPTPNSPVLLNYLWFGARFGQELTTEEFILAFWLRYVVLPWKRGWLKTRLKKVFVYLKIVQSLDFFQHLPTSNWHEVPSVNTVLIQFVFCCTENSLSQNSDFSWQIIHVVSKLFFGQISWNSNAWIGLNFSSNCAAFNWVLRSVARGFLRLISFETNKQTVTFYGICQTAGNTTKKNLSPCLFCFLKARRLLHNIADCAETVFGHLIFKNFLLGYPYWGSPV